MAMGVAGTNNYGKIGKRQAIRRMLNQVFISALPSPPCRGCSAQLLYMYGIKQGKTEALTGLLHTRSEELSEYAWRSVGFLCTYPAQGCIVKGTLKESLRLFHGKSVSP